MQATEAPVRSGSSPPFILDSDMSGRLDSDPDFEFFDSSFSLEAAASPGVFLAEDFATDSHPFATFGSPTPSNFKSPLPDPSSVLDTKIHQPLSAPSTASSAGSYQDSSSDSSRYKRKSSSDSSRSALTSGDLMADDTDMGDWKVDDVMRESDMQTFGGYDGTVNPSSMDNGFAFNDKTMENDFDFDSAASSPSPFGIGPVEMESPEMPTIKYETSQKNSPLLNTKSKNYTKEHSVSHIRSIVQFTVI